MCDPLTMSPLDQVIDGFYDLIMTQADCRPTIPLILSSADKRFNSLTLQRDPSLKAMTKATPSAALLREIEHLKEENEVMTLHLNSELQKLQEKNRVLKEKITLLEKRNLGNDVRATCRSKDTLSFPSDAMSPETMTKDSTQKQSSNDQLEETVALDDIHIRAYPKKYEIFTSKWKMVMNSYPNLNSYLKYSSEISTQRPHILKEKLYTCT